MSADEAFRDQLRALHRAVQTGQEPLAGLLQAGARPSIYQHAYTARLTEALADNYVVLQRAMGDDAFAELAQAYIARHPSQHPSIRWFGAHLAAFMDAEDETLVPHPAFADLARMEWALRTAFDAADAPVLHLEALASIAPGDWPALCFTVHPSVQLVTLHWTVEAAWRTLHGYDPESDAEEPELPAPEPVEHALLAWRPELETHWRSVESAEAHALRAVMAGETFAAVCERTAAFVDPDDAPGVLAGYLRQWVGDGVLAGFAPERLTT